MSPYTHNPRPLDALALKLLKDDPHMRVETKGRESALGWGISDSRHDREPVDTRDGCTVEQDNTAS